ncbi:MAG: hypothetical protein IT428_23575 [Planctomycetaceae bacterium]|nr:hypothetical protein [Planctomycetaceae bacterium]
MDFGIRGNCLAKSKRLPFRVPQLNVASQIAHDELSVAAVLQDEINEQLIAWHPWGCGNLDAFV